MIKPPGGRKQAPQCNTQQHGLWHRSELYKNRGYMSRLIELKRNELGRDRVRVLIGRQRKIRSLSDRRGQQHDQHAKTVKAWEKSGCLSLGSRSSGFSFVGF